MTTIIAFKSKLGSILCADTQGNIGNRSVNVPKIFPIEPRVVAGISGPLFILQAIQDILSEGDVPSLETASQVYSVVNSWNGELEDFYGVDFEKDANGLTLLPYQMFIATENDIFRVLSNGEVISFNEANLEYDSIGSGSSYALGSLYSTQDTPDIESRMRTAMSAAAAFDSATGREILIYQVYENATSH